MPSYSPTTAGLTPGTRVGAGPVSKVLLDANSEREFVLIRVGHEEAKVSVALGETATLDAPYLKESDSWVVIPGYEGALSQITATEGANEKQKVTLANVEGGTYTLAFEGQTTTAINPEAPAAEGTNEKQVVTLANAEGGTFTLTFGAETTGVIASEATNEAVEEALEELETIGAGNVTVTGEAGGPYTVEFVEDLGGTDVAEMTADGTELEGAEAEATVETETPGVQAVGEALEALSTIGEGNVTVTGVEGGPYTVEFVEDLKATDVAELTADGTELEAEEETVASVTVETETRGGVDVFVAEA